jgi:hypothetical protein
MNDEFGDRHRTGDSVFPEGQVTTNHLSSSIPNGTPYDVHDEKWNTTGCSL